MRGGRARFLPLLLVPLLLAPLSAYSALYAVVVEGLGGVAQYTAQFHGQVEVIKAEVAK